MEKGIVDMTSAMPLLYEIELYLEVIDLKKGVIPTELFPAINDMCVW